jgi:hypothetical protein
MGMSYDVSYYSDPNTYIDYDAPAIGMMAITNGPAPEQLSLALDPAFDPEACIVLEDAIAEAPPEATMVEGHFFPHYAPGNIPVTSEGGASLGEIGPDWVLEPMNSLSVEAVGFPNLDPQIPIPCP